MMSGACLEFGTATNAAGSPWIGASDGNWFAALSTQSSTYNVNQSTSIPPFNNPIPNGADNDYCNIMQYGTSTAGHGYTCRLGWYGSQAATAEDYIEVYAK